MNPQRGPSIALRWAALLLLSACSERQITPAPKLEDPPPGVTIQVRGNQEVTLLEDGSVKPRWFGSNRPISICLDAPIELDTSQWQVRLAFAGVPAAEFVDPTIQIGTISCFAQKPPAGLESTQDLEICPTIRDGFDHRHYRLECFRAVFEDDDSAFKRELEAGGAVISTIPQRTREDNIDALDRSAEGLSARGYHLTGTSLRLVSVDELFKARNAEARTEIRQRLEASPAWSRQPPAAVLNVKLTHERARLELVEGRTRRAWQLFSEADDVARRVAALERLSVSIQQARILGRLGAGKEAIKRLQSALAECPPGCRKDLIAAAHQLLGWLLMIDPDATARDLDRAEDSLLAAETAADGDKDTDQANQWINRAFLAFRRGQDPQPALDEATAILALLEPGARRSELLAWIPVVTGLASLAAGDDADAVTQCATAAGATPRIAAWGWSCVGQAERQRGDLDAAAAAFDQAILRHTLAVSDSGLDRPLAPGQRVDDVYRAARVAIERHDLGGAWQLLEALDGFALDRVEACGERTAVDLQHIEQRRHQLLAQLAWTEPPLAPQRQQQIAPVRRSLLESLAELQRDLLADCRGPLQPSPVAADIRAFALGDEVLTLRRSPNSKLVVQRTSLARNALRRRLEQLAEAQLSSQMDDDAWRALAQPIANALLPADPASLGAITRFALHGLLQRTPLAALPVTTPAIATSPITTGADQSWLADATLAVVRPPLVETVPRSSSEGAFSPLFIVDPRRDLPSGRNARNSYRQRFPTARILFGGDASVQAVRAALPSTSFLHIDAHGHYDTAFPELSSLEMADGALRLGDFSRLTEPPYFANLSGCHTGRANPTGDSGHHGLAGVLMRRGTRWVIAHQSAAEDRLVYDFNDIFYREIAAGSRVAEAFRTALVDLRQRYSASAWSNLMLFGTDEGKSHPLGTTQG